MSKRSILVSARTALFLVCLYSATPFAQNKMQRLVRHLYSDYHYLYFTNQTLYLSLLTSVLCTAYRLLRKSRLKAIALLVINTMLPVILSLETIKTCLFWSLYFYNKKLVIYPKYTLPGYETPLLTELGMHLFPLFMLLLEQADMPLERTVCQPMLLVSYVLFYYALITAFAARTGKYLYLFLDVMSSEVLRVAFFAGSLAAGYAVYLCYMRCKRKQQ